MRVHVCKRRGTGIGRIAHPISPKSPPSPSSLLCLVVSLTGHPTCSLTTTASLSPPACCSDGARPWRSCHYRRRCYIPTHRGGEEGGRGGGCGGEEGGRGGLRRAGAWRDSVQRPISWTY